VIAGLQRTGTTMLHRLLSEDPGLRALYSWEALSPVPADRAPRDSSREARILAARLAENGLRYMAPEFFAIHPAEALAPEEEVILLDFSFLSTVPEATLNVPTYSRWLETQDQTPAYEYLRRMLQILMWHTPRERWVLKTPHHLEWLDTLLAVFPGARIIQTHRDPLKTIASLSSMITHGRGVFSDDVDPHAVGAHWSRKVYRMVDRAMTTREGPHASQFLDVSYYDLMKAPMHEVERIYGFVGRTLTGDVQLRVDASRDGNKQHRYGRHSYRLEDFGLTAETVEPSIARYRERFAIPKE
ncbi:MAG: sulfotransferase, partial [Polyangiaceae bacterium]|nr:sulfotransferase [Polyangiaceae bacterium]